MTDDPSTGVGDDPRLAELRIRFPTALTEEQWALVATRLTRARSLATALRAAPLGNGDQPEAVFVPYRADAVIDR